MSSNDLRPIVQKYGGTSVGSIDRIKAVAERVKESVGSGRRIAVVVSAMSGETNRLVDLVNQVNPATNRRNYDMAVAAGEQVSAALVAAALDGLGCQARALLAHQLGIFTSSMHSKARIHGIACDKLYAAWDRGEIPVVAGFQGVTQDLEITTLGRGGSDTSAVALAVALGAEYCEINTDVDGVYTTDPRIVPEARLIKRMDFETALEMAAMGSKVLHSRSVEIGAKYKMPIIVRHSFNSDPNIGTHVMAYSEQDKLEAPVVSGITLDRNVVKISIDGLGVPGVSLAEIFAEIAKADVNVDVIIHNHSPALARRRVGFTIGSGDRAKALEALTNYLRDKNSVEIHTEEGLAKLSVVGLGMISHPGVASRVFATLSDAGVDVLMVSTSEIKISCVIPAEAADTGVQVLHREFI